MSGANVHIDVSTGETVNTQAVWENSTWHNLERTRGRTLARSNSVIGSRDTNNTKHQCIVIVDPFSTGAHLAAAVRKAGLLCARVLSTWDSPVAALVQKGLEVEYCATIQHNDQEADINAAINATINSIKGLPFPTLAVIPGAETGVELADALSHRLGLRSNGEAGSFARRNKYVMGETVRKAKVRAVKQQLVTSLKELEDFLANLPTKPFKCVLKPVQSAGTDDVFLCDDIDEAKIAFQKIFGKRNGLGAINDSVLAQEFLRGKEYVVDQVSRDGVHKIVAIWEYDKRSVNDANFVYFGFKLVSPISDMCQKLIAYANQVLDALGILHGPSHMEVMMTPDGPCLVEVGSRCHGGEASWLPVVQECLGYSMLEGTLASYVRPDRFDALPFEPATLLKQGCEAFLVSMSTGTIKSIPGLEVIRCMSSFRRMEMFTQPGALLVPTIDCFTRPGSVQMVNESAEELERDYLRVRELEHDGLFELL